MDFNNNLDKLKALKSRISISLGEKRTSPLFGKVSIGEDKKIITSEAIVSALGESNFLGKVTKNKIEKLGTFFRGDLDDCFEKLYKYISYSFLYIYNNTENIWNKDGNIIVINKGIYSLIKILSDITDYLINKDYIKENFSINELSLETKNLLDPIIIFYKNISDEQINELKTSYGKGGDIRYWRTLQQEIKKSIKDFSPDGLDEYLRKEEREFNEEAFKTIREIEQYLNINIKEKLIENYGEDFRFEDGVPPKIQDDAVKMAHQKRRENKKEEEPWNCLHIIDYRDIMLKNWRNLFEKKYGIIFGDKSNGNKEDKTQWLVELNRLRNQNVHSYYVTKEEFDFLKKIEYWLII